MNPDNNIFLYTIRKHPALLSFFTIIVGLAILLSIYTGFHIGFYIFFCVILMIGSLIAYSDNHNEDSLLSINVLSFTVSVIMIGFALYKISSFDDAIDSYEDYNVTDYNIFFQDLGDQKGRLLFNRKGSSEISDTIELSDDLIKEYLTNNAKIVSHITKTKYFQEESTSYTVRINGVKYDW